MRNLITLVIPCYNEEEALPLFMQAIEPVRRELSMLDDITPADTELVFIDDGSSDCTLKLLREYHAADTSVRYISFSRNFGKEAGIYAGLKASKGDYVILLDADLQHPVEFIPTMYRTLLTETINFPDAGSSVNRHYDSVAMYRSDRTGDSRLRAHFSKRFFRLMNKLSKIDLVEGATDFRIMSRKMVDSVLEMQEYNRFTKGIFNWVGYSTKWVPYANRERCAGTSKWSASGLIRYAFEGMFAFSTTPLTISFSLGLILCILAILYAAFTVIKTLIWGDPVAGFPTLFTFILLIGGIQLLFLGIIGQYLSKMYLETKHRPIFIERESSEDK